MTPKYLPQVYDVFIGLDVDKTSYAFTVTNHSNMSRSKKVPAVPEAFGRYLKKHFSTQRVLCAYEAGPTGYDLYDQLTQQQYDCLVVSPMSIPKAANQRVKNNRLDSLKIAEELRAGKLKAITVPQGAYRDLRHLVNMRERYARNRKVAKQRIKSFLLYTALHRQLPDDEDNRWSNRHISLLKALPCSAAQRQQLDSLLMDLDYARRQTTHILRQLRTFVGQDDEIRRMLKLLLSIPGVGFITAVSVLARIGHPQRLNDSKELGAFVGLVPTEKSTGNSIKQGSITHLGNRTLRSLLIQAAWTAIRYDKELDQFFHRIKRRHHPKIGPRKAIVAVARKLTLRMYTVLKQQRPYVQHLRHDQ